MPRSFVTALAAVSVVASALVATTPAQAANSPSPKPSPKPTASVAAPAPVLTATTPGVPTIAKLVAGPGSGQLTATYVAPTSDGGSPVTSYDASIDDGVTWWACAPAPGTCTLTNLTNGRPYTITLRAVNVIGPGAASLPVTGTPAIPPGLDPDRPQKLPKPRVWVNASFNAASNSLGVDGATTKLGVGTLPRLSFSRSIPDKRVVETHLTVMSTLKDGKIRKVKGSWAWMDDRTVIFRPKNYWPGHATITIASTLDRAVMGKTGKYFVVGSNTLAQTYTFKTARRLIAKVDGGTDRMKVYVDGKKVKDFGVSLGKTDWETRNGVKVISTLKEPKHTYTSTALNLDPTVETPYELKDIPWNTRLTPTGEFIHSAPWAYGRIGRYNGSHGCTNMFEADAKWIYDKTIPGDVVLYVNTGGDVVPAWNGPGGLWNIPWDAWVKKSALTSVTGNPDTTDPLVAKPGDVSQDASA
jgi:lipoprotein-anchoring transpeptidase ErfK/SrfK